MLSDKRIFPKKLIEYINLNTNKQYSCYEIYNQLVNKIEKKGRQLIISDELGKILNIGYPTMSKKKIMYHINKISSIENMSIDDIKIEI